MIIWKCDVWSELLWLPTLVFTNTEKNDITSGDLNYPRSDTNKATTQK